MDPEDLLEVVRVDLRGFDFEAAPLGAPEGPPCALAHVRLPGRLDVLLRYAIAEPSRQVAVRVIAPCSPQFVAAVHEVAGPEASGMLATMPDGRLEAGPLTRQAAARLLGRLALPP